MKRITSESSGVWPATSITLALLLSLVSGAAHDERLHAEMTGLAFRASDGLLDFLNDALGPSPDGYISTPILTLQPYPYQKPTPLPPVSWLREGSWFEDYEDLTTSVGVRSANHFYTPLPNRIRRLTDATESLILPSPLVDSYEWASVRGTTGPILSIAGRTIFAVPRQTESWQNARDYQYAALTSATKAGRDSAAAHMLYALGHVLHLNQDLSQPSHVRNDEHPRKKYIEKYGRQYYQTSGVNNPAWFRSPPPERTGWLYWRSEGFQTLRDFWDRSRYIGASKELDEDASSFPSGKRLGLAEFSNGNFISEDAVYEEFFPPGPPGTPAGNEYALHHFPFPSITNSTDFSAKIAKPSKGAAPTFLRNKEFVQRIIVDKTANGIKFPNHSVVLHNGLKKGKPPTIPVSTTINDPNVLETYHRILIPKAIEFSTGILDYFFRGLLDVTYSPSDTSPDDLVLEIRNLSGQNLQDGSVALYYDDVNGNRLPVPSFTTDYNPANGVNDQDTVAAQFTPIGGSSTEYLLVFRGTIGGKDDGQPIDVIDGGIAIAIARFTIGCDQPYIAAPPACSTLTSIDGPPAINIIDGVGTTTTSPFNVPPVGSTVVVNVEGAGGNIAGRLVIVEGAGEFEVVASTTWPQPETLTLLNHGIPSNVQGGTLVPNGTAIANREAPQSWNAVYVPTVNRVFVNAANDMYVIYNPNSMALQGYFHASNLIDDYNPGPLVYACDVDRLYTVSSYGNIYVINPHTQKVETVIPWTGGGIGFFGLSLSDGFFDPINHRIGFAYENLDEMTHGLVLINTSDNTISGDLANDGLATVDAAYSVADNRTYFSEDGTIRIYSGASLDPETTIYVGTTVWSLRYAPITGEMYGYAGPNLPATRNAFYIDPSGTYSDVTTADSTAPAVGDTTDFFLNNTSGMVSGQACQINGVAWTIVTAVDQQHFTARNMSVTPGATIATSASVTWGGLRYTPVPSVANPDGLFYSAAYRRMIFHGPHGASTQMLDPITKTVGCVINDPPQTDLYDGCDGPNGTLFVPSQLDVSPYTNGIQILH